MFHRLVLGIVVLAIVIAAAWATSGTKPVSYPTGYRSWTHAKTLILRSGHPLYEDFGGIHHVYANNIALGTLKAGKGKFPNGSVLVFDLFDAPEKNNTISEGQRKVTAVMVKNSRLYKETGGWGFEAFKADSRERVVKDPVKDCFNCHAGQAHRDYVFSEYRP